MYIVGQLFYMYYVSQIGEKACFFKIHKSFCTLIWLSVRQFFLSVLPFYKILSSHNSEN
jgi:hypothetical protein